MRYYNDYLQTEDELVHYGVLGMKWGVRHDPERSFNYKRHMRAAEATARDAKNLYDNGFKAEAKGVYEVSKKQRAKAERIKSQRQSELNELRGYGQYAKKHPKSLAASKLSTAVRNHQIKALQRKKKYKEAVERNHGKYFKKVSRKEAIVGSVLSFGAASGLAYSALNDLKSGNTTGAVLKTYGAYSLAGLSGTMAGMEAHRPKN